MRVLGRADVNPFYEPFAEALRRQPYGTAAREFLRTSECQEKMVLPSLGEKIKSIPTHGLVTPFYWALGGAVALSTAFAVSQASHYAPHGLYGFALWGAFYGGVLGGIRAMSKINGTTNYAHKLRRAKFMVPVIAGVFTSLISIQTHSHQHVFDNASPNRAVAEAESKTADSEYLLAMGGGKPLCRSPSERDLSVCIIDKLGYFKPVDVYRIQPGKDPVYLNLTAKDL